MSKASSLSRRERQIMDIVYEIGTVSAQQVRERLPDPPSYSAVRAMLKKLEDKGHLAHEEQGAKYFYRPLVAREQASKNAISRLIKTFFDDSPSQAANALLGMSMEKISPQELEEIEALIKDAKAKK